MASQIKKKNTKKWIVFAIIAIILVALLILLFSPKSKVRYNEDTVRALDIKTYYSFSGNIESKKDTVTYSTSNDQIRKVHVVQGDTVKEDDLILTAQSGQKYKANMNGTISSISVDEKDNYLSGTELYRIADFSSPQVSIKVDEYDVGALAVGMPVDVYIHPLEKTVEGSIREISLEATVTDNISFYEALVDVQQDGTLRMGMSCEVTLLKDFSENATAVPIEAIQFDEYLEPYVYVYGKSKNEVIKSPIKLGINDGNSVEILSGLSVGDIILTPQKNNLAMMPMMNRQGGN